jgi:hypothetical protein
MPYIDLKKIRTEKHWTNRIKDGVRRIKDQAVEKCKAAVEYAKENPQVVALLIGGGGMIIKTIGKVTRSIDRHSKLKQETYNKERFIYDRSLNMYLKTKRPLNNKDYKRINERKKKTGRKYSEILDELDLLA